MSLTPSPYGPNWKFVEVQPDGAVVYEEIEEELPPLLPPLPDPPAFELPDEEDALYDEMVQDLIDNEIENQEGEVLDDPFNPDEMFDNPFSPDNYTQTELYEYEIENEWLSATPDEGTTMPKATKQDIYRE